MSPEFSQNSSALFVAKGETIEPQMALKWHNLKTMGPIGWGGHAEPVHHLGLVRAVDAASAAPPLPGVIETQTNKRLGFVIVYHVNAAAVVKFGVVAR